MRPLFLRRCLKQGLGKQEVQLQASCPCDFFFPLRSVTSSLLSLAWKKKKKKRKKRKRQAQLHFDLKLRRRAGTLSNVPSLSARQRVTIVDNLDTQSRSAGLNPPISLRERARERERERGSRVEEKGGIVTGDSAVKRGTYSTKLRSRRDNGCPSLAHSHTLSTQLYQTPLSFLPPRLCSALSLSFSPVRLSSPHHRGMGDNETPAHPGCCSGGGWVGVGGFREEELLVPPQQLTFSSSPFRALKEQRGLEARRAERFLGVILQRSAAAAKTRTVSGRYILFAPKNKNHTLFVYFLTSVMKRPVDVLVLSTTS